MAHQTSTCRSCPAQVVWCITINGKRMPVDAEPGPDGNLILIDDEIFGDQPPMVVNKSNPDVEGYTSHFATCTHSDEWRKR